MNWQPIETATEGHQVLLAWGSEASGPIGYAIATKHGEQWIDQHCKRVDIDGYCVIAWQTLPPLPNVNDGQLRRFFGRCEDCGKKVKVLRGGQCALCHAAHPKMPNNAEINSELIYDSSKETDDDN